MTDHAVSSPKQYGAEFQGFVIAFRQGFFGTDREGGPLSSTEAIEDAIRRAATSAWEDYLIRRRRVETFERKAAAQGAAP